MAIQSTDLYTFFNPQSIAVIGVSEKEEKVGHVLFKNLIDGKFGGELFAVNKNGGDILGRRVYQSILQIEKKIDVAIIVIPAAAVLTAVKQCKQKGVKNLLIISAGFSEVGNKQLEDTLARYLQKNKMRAIGVNCLGIFDSYHNLDALFIPRYKLKRPERGCISFVCQSGAIGAAILDIASEKGHKFSKFISYGNATNVDESDILTYLGEDETTKVICLYLEGIKNGEKFFTALQKVSVKKPIIAIKGGLTEEGSKAVMSHTGSLSGKKEVFFGIFNQTGVIRAESLEEMFDIASLFEYLPQLKGNKIQVITNGGGFGILSTDIITLSPHLEMAQLSQDTRKNLREFLPPLVAIHNPLDLIGDATTERYRVALAHCMKDKNSDILMVIILYQTPLLTKDIIEVMIQTKETGKKPIFIVSTGGEFTHQLSEHLKNKSIPVFSYPENAIKALDKVVWYYGKIKNFFQICRKLYSLT